MIKNWHSSCYLLSMNKTRLEKKRSKIKVHSYYKCPRCGYVSIIKDSYCPVCAKDGVKIKVE